MGGNVVGSGINFTMAFTPFSAPQDLPDTPKEKSSVMAESPFQHHFSGPGGAVMPPAVNVNAIANIPVEPSKTLLLLLYLLHHNRVNVFSYCNMLFIYLVDEFLCFVDCSPDHEIRPGLCIYLREGRSEKEVVEQKKKEIINKEEEENVIKSSNNNNYVNAKNMREKELMIMDNETKNDKDFVYTRVYSETIDEEVYSFPPGRPFHPGLSVSPVSPSSSSSSSSSSSETPKPSVGSSSSPSPSSSTYVYCYDSNNNSYYFSDQLFRIQQSPDPFGYAKSNSPHPLAPRLPSSGSSSLNSSTFFPTKLGFNPSGEKPSPGPVSPLQLVSSPSTNIANPACPPPPSSSSTLANPSSPFSCTPSSHLVAPTVLPFFPSPTSATLTTSFIHPLLFVYNPRFFSPFPVSGVVSRTVTPSEPEHPLLSSSSFSSHFPSSSSSSSSSSSTSGRSLLPSFTLDSSSTQSSPKRGSPLVDIKTLPSLSSTTFNFSSLKFFLSISSSNNNNLVNDDVLINPNPESASPLNRSSSFSSSSFSSSFSSSSSYPFFSKSPLNSSGLFFRSIPYKQQTIRLGNKNVICGGSAKSIHSLALPMSNKSSSSLFLSTQEKKFVKKDSGLRTDNKSLCLYV
jgi:hypothetical protein